MQHTSCTEDRIHHALERCLHGLTRNATFSTTWTAGLCLNCWSLQELVSRDPANFLILLDKILEQTKQAQEQCEYNLLTPLAVMFYSTVLCTPHFPPESGLLRKAIKTFHSFLTWPVPYCNIYQELLSFITEELKAPGISYQRLVRAEQGLTTANLQNPTITVLLMNPTEIQHEFLSVAEKLSSTEQHKHSCYIILIKHIYQSSFGTRCDLSELCQVLQSKTLDELAEIFSDSTEALETAVMAQDPAQAREWLQTKLKDIGERAELPTMTGNKQTCNLQTLPLPIARCHTYSWEQDNFDILNDVFLEECGVLKRMSLTDELNEEEDDVEIDGGSPQRDSVISALSVASKDSTCSMMSTVSQDFGIATLSISSKNSIKSFASSLSNCVDSGFMEDSDENSQESVGKPDFRDEKMQKAGQKLTRKFYNLFKSKSHSALKKDSKYLIDIHGSSPCSTYPSMPLSRAKSLCSPEGKDRIPAPRSKRSRSLPQQTISSQIKERQLAQNVAFSRRPFLSFDEESKSSTLRVIVFGSDRISGKVARAYSNLRLQESKCPLLTKYFKLQFFYVPVKRNCLTSPGPLTHHCPIGDTQPRHSIPMDTRAPSIEESTNDISHYIGMLDPWYERNVLGLMNLSTAVLCQQSSKPENESSEGPKKQLPILADMILYYCRFATRPVLLQLYQAELTFDGGQSKTEVFIHSLELGHSAATRAIKASGPGSKRLGIEGDREAIPLTLQIVYSKTTVSGRSRWNNGEKVCTSVNLSKACTKYEELDSKMECLNLTVTEVVKRQNSKSKKSFNQISVSQIKIDKAQIIGVNNCTFAVCLDQDERKILQNVTRCEVSPCYKPESLETRQLKKPPSYQFPPSKSEFCSLLCLPIATFSGALP
ncbi:phosphoinositide 3-kinase regulatory subunit 5 [Microcaecilia unicolor]|uniref:Phosphoinositide 3-kinase regulatory subunit 5 n=1 Tax=Microcaecilia unicolor TaxID=1415580 RepID=A0A6P7YAV0_9AMPH|nr:phosphoinositide 3-kinase regulatory subunit 5 [Microcaecilia unicolor]